MPRILIISILLALFGSLWGQERHVELQALAASDDAQVAAKAYKDLAIESCDSLVLHRAYAEKGITLARSIGDQMMVGNILTNLGVCHGINGKFEQSISYYDSAEVVFLSLQGVDDWLASLYINYGAAYYFAGMRSSALAYWLKAYEKNGEESKDENLGILLNNIANTYEELEKYDDALSYYQKSLSYKKDRVDEVGYFTTMMNLGRLYGKMNQTDLALESLGIAADGWRDLDRENDLLASQIYQTEVLVGADKTNEAAELIFPRANAILNLPKNSRKVEGLLVIADVHKMLQNCDEAIRQYSNAQRIVSENNLSFELPSILDKLADCYAQTDKYDQAYQALRESSNLERTHTKSARLQLEQEMQVKFNTLQKEQENRYLQAQNSIKDLQIKRARQKFWLASIGLVLAAAFVLSVYLSRKKIRKLNTHLRQQRDAIQIALKDKEILLKEIHHRVKNNLQVISSLLGIQSRQIKDETALEAIRQGRSRVESMSLIHQDLYQKNNLTGVDLQRYFRRLVGSLFDTYNLSEDEITLTADIEPLRLDVDSVIPLGLIVNELISNALKYAFPNDSGIIHVILKETDAGISLAVRDNGIGMTQPELVAKGDSFGYDLIQSLVDKMDGTLEIIIDNGTEVRALLKDFKKAA